MMMNLIIKHETNKIFKKNTHESLITLGRQKVLPFVLSLSLSYSFSLYLNRKDKMDKLICILSK